MSKGKGRAFTIKWTPEKIENMKKQGYIFIDPEIKRVNKKEGK